MKKYDLASGLVWLILGIGICLESTRVGLGRIHSPGAGFLPLLSGALLGLFGLVLIYSTFSRRSGQYEEVRGEKFWEKENWELFRLPLLNLLALFGYTFLLEPLGFVLTTFSYIFFLFKVTEPKRWLMPLVFSIVSVSISYLLFIVWLRCQFPSGITGFFMR